MTAKQPSPGAIRRAKAFLSRYTALAAEDYPDALEALARLLVREYRRGFNDAGEAQELGLIESNAADSRERQTFGAALRAGRLSSTPSGYELPPDELAYQRQRWDEDAASFPDSAIRPCAEMLTGLEETATTKEPCEWCGKVLWLDSRLCFGCAASGGT